MIRPGSFTLVPALITLFAVAAFLLVLNFAIPPAKQTSNTNTTNTAAGDTMLANQNVNVYDTDLENQNSSAANVNQASTNTAASNTNSSPASADTYVNTKYGFSLSTKALKCSDGACDADSDAVDFYVTDQSSVATRVAKPGSAVTAREWLQAAGLDHANVSLTDTTLASQAAVLFVNTSNYNPSDYNNYLPDSEKISLRINGANGGTSSTLFTPRSRGVAVIKDGQVYVILNTVGLSQAAYEQAYTSATQSFTFTQ